MSSLFSRCCLVVCILSCSFLLAAASPLSAQTRIEIRLDSVYAAEGQTARMPIYLANYLDTLAGIQMYFQVDRPGICSLMVTVDTVGTLLSGWPYVEWRRIGAGPYDVSIVAVSTSPGGGSVPPLAPQSGEVPLVYLNLKVFTGLDPLFDTEAFINVRTNDPSWFGFSTPQGMLVGMTLTEVTDTLYYRCLQWAGDDCLGWQQVSLPPYDSMAIVIDTMLVLDTSQVKVLQRGYVGITPWVCGDFNGDRFVNLTDVTLLVNYLFGNGPPPGNLAPIDVASPCEFQINLTDLTLLVNRLFQSGPPLTCCPYQ